MRRVVWAIVGLLGGGGCGAEVPPAADPALACFAHMTGGSPNGGLPAGTRSVTLSLRTDRDAVCRYATVEGLYFIDMEDAFSNTGGREHSTLLAGLVDGGHYRYFAKCRAAATGCPNPHDHVIIFSVASAP